MSGPLDPSDPRFAYMLRMLDDRPPDGRGGCGATAIGVAIILLGFCLLIGFLAR